MNDFDKLGWKDVAFLSGMAEDIANEEMKIEQARRDTFGTDYIEHEDPTTDIDDKNTDTDFDFDP
jgi:hypothetical protein